MFDPQSTADYWTRYMEVYDGIGTIADADALLLSDDELAALSDEIDAIAVPEIDDDDDAILLPFSDGLGFDVPAWPNMSDDDMNAEAPF